MVHLRITFYRYEVNICSDKNDKLLLESTNYTRTYTTTGCIVSYKLADLQCNADVKIQAYPDTISKYGVVINHLDTAGKGIYDTDVTEKYVKLVSRAQFRCSQSNIGSGWRHDATHYQL